MTTVSCTFMPVSSSACTVARRIGRTWIKPALKFRPLQLAFGGGNSYIMLPEIVTTAAGSCTVIETSSVSASPAESVTVRRKLRTSGLPANTSGAVNAAFADVALLIVTLVPAICVQEKDTLSPASGSDPLPVSCTSESSTTVWSLPAFAVGARLTGASPPSPPPPPQAASNSAAIASKRCANVLPKCVYSFPLRGSREV